MNTVETEGEGEGEGGENRRIHVLSLKEIPTQWIAGKTEHISFFWGKSGEDGVRGGRISDKKCEV